jgi:alpha-tubulin suppressor-like RCC1 family protein
VVASGNVAKCWGRNTNGQLGSGSTTNSSLPKTVKSTASKTLGAVVDVTGGSRHTCARISNNTARCWGFNGSGELGNGTNTQSLFAKAVRDPANVGALIDVRAIDAGTSHTCARVGPGTLGADGAVCWGLNTSGQLGNGSNTSSPLPVAVRNDANTANLGGVMPNAMAAGGATTCAQIVLDTRCWGGGAFGQLGNGGNAGSNLPVNAAPGDLSGQLDVGTEHVCVTLSAIMSSPGAVVCFGRNDQGQLGNGTNANSSVPVAVTT